jgi:hypothetical protein
MNEQHTHRSCDFMMPLILSCGDTFSIGRVSLWREQNWMKKCDAGTRNSKRGKSAFDGGRFDERLYSMSKMEATFHCKAICRLVGWGLNFALERVSVANQAFCQPGFSESGGCSAGSDAALA